MRRFEAHSLNCVDRSVNYLRPNCFKGARGFVRYLILRHYVRLGLTPSLIIQGSKVLQFVDTDFRLKFIDSISFLTMLMVMFPKALRFTDKVKGLFPHKFSSEDCLHYVGPYPWLADYDTR